MRILQGLLRARGEAAYPYAPGAPGGKRLMLGIENGQDRTAGSTSIEREVGVYILSATGLRRLTFHTNDRTHKNAVCRDLNHCITHFYFRCSRYATFCCRSSPPIDLVTKPLDFSLSLLAGFSLTLFTSRSHSGSPLRK